MPIEYEWDCEKVDRESGDVIDHYYGGSLAEVIKGIRHDPQYKYDIVLVRNDVNESCTDCSYAYLKEDGTLPEHFTEGDCVVAKVPKRFHAECTRRSRPS